MVITLRLSTVLGFCAAIAAIAAPLLLGTCGAAGRPAWPLGPASWRTGHCAPWSPRRSSAFGLLAGAGGVEVLRLRHADGRWAWTRHTLAVVAREEGGDAEIIGFVVEVTAEWAARARAAAAGRLASLGGMGAGLAHELNQALATISLAAGNAPHDGRRGDAAAEEGGMVRLDIADTGGGIPPGILPRLFEPFVSGKDADRGTGLGLSICHRLVTAMGGTIEARNGAEGAVFTLRPPAA